MQQKRIAGKRGRRRTARSPATKQASEETIGERLRRLRYERGLSQRDLAGPGVSYAYISRIEVNARQPSLRAIRALARTLGVTPEYLETGDPVPRALRREWRLASAELALQGGHDLEHAEAVFREESRTTDGRPRARALAGLGLIAARRKQLREAVAMLEAATRSGHLGPETRPEIYDALAETYFALDAGEQAVVLLQSCLRELSERAAGDTLLQARFGVRLAAAQASVGAFERAGGALEQATRLARGRPAPLSRSLVYSSSAKAAWPADPETAVAHMRRAIGLLQAETELLEAARAHVAAAHILNTDARHEDATVHLERAERLLTLGATDTDLGMLRAEQAKLAAYRGQAERALALATEAADLLDNDPLQRANLAHAHAAAYAAGDQPDPAEANYKHALGDLTELQQWRHAAQVARELARLLHKLGREPEAFQLLDRAALLMIRRQNDVPRREPKRRHEQPRG